MKIKTKNVFIEKSEIIQDNEFQLSKLKTILSNHLNYLTADESPIRFIITKTTDAGYECEVDVLNSRIVNNIFDYKIRKFEDTNQFNVALMIPTGIGCELGGHAGDAGVLAKAFASSCDNLITHPNVVNAANYNEMEPNTFYTEGSTFTRLFMGKIGLIKPRMNRILILVDKHKNSFFNEELINAASTARVTLGVECFVHVMHSTITSKFVWSESGRAAGVVEDLGNLFKEIESIKWEYDAIALSTGILMPEENYDVYFKTDQMNVNPFGGIEAMLTHAVSLKFNVPAAHAPLGDETILEKEFGVIDPRKSAESNSVADIHCVLKGLYKSPKIVRPKEGLNAKNISCLVVPEGCVGLPVLAAFKQGIPVIAVEENKNIMRNDFSHYPFKNKRLFNAKNYWEALGLVQCLKAGIDPYTVRRPIEHTKRYGF